MRRCTRETHHDAIAARASDDHSHPVGVNHQRPDLSRHAAAHAFRARGSEIGNKNLAQYSGDGVAVHVSRIETLTGNY
jgi:hypothetical protein